MEILIFFFFVGGLIGVVFLVTTARNLYWIKNAANTQNNISRKILEELREIKAMEFDKTQIEPEKPKRPAVELPPKSKASKPTIYEL